MRNDNLSHAGYTLACYQCHEGKKLLMMVAHRNVNNDVIGFLYVCKDCFPKVAGKNLKTQIKD
jgi:hypothetical protein